MFSAYFMSCRRVCSINDQPLPKNNGILVRVTLASCSFVCLLNDVVVVVRHPTSTPHPGLLNDARSHHSPHQQSVDKLGRSLPFLR